jgi:hypothetical protein
LFDRPKPTLGCSASGRRSRIIIIIIIRGRRRRRRRRFCPSSGALDCVVQLVV